MHFNFSIFTDFYQKYEKLSIVILLMHSYSICSLTFENYGWNKSSWKNHVDCDPEQTHG